MGKSSSSEDSQLQAAQAQLANVMSQTGQPSAQESSTPFNLALRDIEQPEAYYKKLRSDEPLALARANSPAIQQITGSADTPTKNIIQGQPRGCEGNLALEEAGNISNEMPRSLGK
jgi:hypothetical protein